MTYQVLGDTIALRLQIGEEIITSITAVCEKEHITAGTISGLGAADHAVVGLYRVGEKKYFPTELDRDMEITSLIGNISQMDGKVYLHIHATFADDTGRVFGGHLNEATISATAEIFLRRLDGTIGRRHDASIGLNLMDV
ncbi:DNA-binding protein [Neobittarella massiliensis]|uniref:DNA-binding protein n=2 Tax=Oscillospiraceae TaxID=216572 RepID=A0A8J6IRA5_9FIRM|nr:PPC domain-containing DNA-binding protein [Neobittarella massiliensis]MBC3517348.1 DNA-binding protein [Neobittarella massiliensis]SCJ91717.1 Predicted DNA-binding protein with PD1-like DNA-binding motif [uncultured Anaerotruncus sp.]